MTTLEWNAKMIPITILFDPTTNTRQYIGKSIVIYAPFMDSSNIFIPNEVAKGIILQMIQTPQTNYEGEFYGNYITIQTNDNSIETIYYGIDFDSFKNYKIVNKNLDKNRNLALLSMKSLYFR